jgi:hypothetical protein
MNNKATVKQLNYLQSILKTDNINLNTLTNKSLKELTHKDITSIFKKLDTPITPFLQNTKYVIKKEINKHCFIGQQIKINPTKTVMDLIVFDNMCVIDWDVSDEFPTKPLLLEFLKKFLKTFEYSFLLYETFKGYHGYIVSHTFDFYSRNTVKLLQSLKCDPFYIGFTRKVGFVVRLNKKTNRNETFIEKFCYQINDFPILPELQELIDIKETFINF